MFDWLKQNESETKLVKNDLITLEHRLLGFLKTNALGRVNVVSGSELARQFGLESTVQVRQVIKKLRNSPTVDVKIGSCKDGYFIPTRDEYLESIQYMLKKTLSQIKTTIKMYPRATAIIHKVAHEELKTNNTAVDGQMQIKFNGWENDIIKLFADGYIDDDKLPFE